MASHAAETTASSRNDLQHSWVASAETEVSQVDAVRAIDNVLATYGAKEKFKSVAAEFGPKSPPPRDDAAHMDSTSG